MERLKAIEVIVKASTNTQEGTGIGDTTRESKRVEADPGAAMLETGRLRGPQRSSRLGHMPMM
jgi:hypothetical protein